MLKPKHNFNENLNINLFPCCTFRRRVASARSGTLFPLFRQSSRHQSATSSHELILSLAILLPESPSTLHFPYLPVLPVIQIHSFDRIFHCCVGRDSSVGIATRYGLDGPGIESRRGRDFPHLSRPALGPTQPPILWVPGLSRG